MKDFDALFRELGDMTSSANTTCRNFTRLLENLGFEISDCGNAGHKIARHPAVSLTAYPNFDCGHNLGSTVKRPYIKKLFVFVETHQESIKQHLK
jgi:hypothetical protein